MTFIGDIVEVVGYIHPIICMSPKMSNLTNLSISFPIHAYNQYQYIQPFTHSNCKVTDQSIPKDKSLIDANHIAQNDLNFGTFTVKREYAKTQNI